jgi:hypothetical protein
MTNTFRRAVKVFIDTNLTPAARSAALAAYAEKTVNDLVQSGKASPRYRQFVDGVEGASPLNVRRVIADQFAYTGDAAVFALEFLRGRVPVRSGRFRDSFIVAVEGKPTPGLQFDARQAGATSTIIIYSPLPFERKIDVQLAGKTTLHFSGPSGMFNDAVREVRGRFGNSVRVARVSNIKLPGAYLLRGTRDKGTPVQTPALIISPLE